jgi:threonine/homoserine efflux transporter RhtA
MPCIPVTTAVMGAVVLGEMLTISQFVAIAAITFGMVFPMLQKS